MLYILLSIIIIIPVLAGFGEIFQKIFGEIWQGISAKLISGMVSVSIIWLIIAFFFPLNMWVEIITITVGLCAFLYFKIYENFWNFFRNQKWIFYIILLIIIFFGTFFPFILDYFGYYVPTIKWLSEFGLVKGIANLDLLLGQMSVWHIFQAGFSHFTDVFFRINTLVLVIYLIYIFEKKSLIHLVFLPILFLFSQSPSSDLPVVFLSLVVLNEIFFNNKNISWLFAVSVYIFAIKPTMIWVPLFVFLYGIFVLKSNLKFILAGSFILILFFIKNIYCFGFPVFPVQIGDLGISWNPNPELLKISSQTAIEKTYDLQFKYQEIQKFSTVDYIKNWFFLKGIKSKIHILFILSLLVFGSYAFFKKEKLVWLLFVSVLVKSIIVLLFSAQYRFFIDVFFVVVFVIFYQNFSKKIAFVLFSVLSLFFASFLSFPNLVKTYLPSFKLGQYITGFQKSQLIKPAYFEWKQYERHQVGNLKFNIVKDYPFSFDVALPAISPEFIKEDNDAGIFPQQNSENPKDGFHWDKLDEKEKLQLKKITEKLNPDFLKK